MPQFSSVLIVANEGELGLVEELATILEREGVGYDFAAGREEALEKIKIGRYGAVYISSNEIDLGSKRMPPQEDLSRVGERSAFPYGKRIAAMFEIVRTAREKGLGVIVDEEDSSNFEHSQLVEMGAITTSLLKQDAYDKYQELKKLLAP